jgi:hypothetical protein
MKKILGVLILITSFTLFYGCKEKPSLLRVYVRNDKNNLLEKGINAKVLISSDPTSTPPTAKYSDAKMTNDASFAEFDLNGFFATQKATYGDTVREGYFKINVKLDEFEGDTTVRATYKTTSVQTIYLNYAN